MNELALFAGAGGGLLATHHLLGWRCVGYVEMAEYPCKVLEARINDGLLSPAPIFHMRTREFTELGLAELYRGVADIVTAGFPCQPFSQAGKRLGADDERNGWPDTITIIRQVRPRYVLLENVARLTSNPYFGVILGDLAASGYDCRWDCIPASAIGANHERDRVWIVGWNTHLSYVQEFPPFSNASARQATNTSRDCDIPDANDQRHRATFLHKSGQPHTQPGSNGEIQLMADTHPMRCQRDRTPQPQGGTKPENGSSNVSYPNKQRRYKVEQPDRGRTAEKRSLSQAVQSNREWWEVEPEVGRVVDELAYRVGQLRAIGNGQVPAVVSQVWQLLKP